MKFNKKIAVPFLSTVMGLSLIGGVGGAVAWYQYNTRVTASFVGASVANTGVLQIGQIRTDHDPSTGDPVEKDPVSGLRSKSMKWGRDLNDHEIIDGVDELTGSTNDNKLSPVTFGQLLSNQEQTFTNRLPSKAYSNPEAGKGAYTVKNSQNEDVDNWDVATKGKEYLQFDLYLRAFKSDSTVESGYSLVEKDVYLSDIVLDEAIQVENKTVAEALRIHLAVYKKDNDATESKNLLISQKKVTNLELSGNLDLDRDGADDKVGGWAWNEGKDSLVTYGKAGDKQNTLGIDDIKLAHEADVDTSKVICKTNTDADHPVKIRVTVWIEGWHLLNSDKVYADDYAVEDLRGKPIPSALWNPYYNAGYNVRVGMEFDARSFEA